MFHAKAVKDGTFGFTNVANHILNQALKSQNFDDARKVFDNMLHRDVRSWTILISGIAGTGYFRPVVNIFRAMQKEKVLPNEFTLSSVLRSCSISAELRPGKEIHGWIVTNGVVSDNTLENALLDLYMKCGEHQYAERLFETGEKRDTVAWNIMIDGFMKSGEVKKSVALFNRVPNRDVASWNTMMHGLMRNGQGETALELLSEMIKYGPFVNEVTLSSALVLTSNLAMFKLGRQIHALIKVLGVIDIGYVRTSLISFYSNFGKMDEALSISFEAPEEYLRFLSSRTMSASVIYSSLISGFSRNGRYETAVMIFASLIRKRAGIDSFSVSILLSRCTTCGTLPLGRQIHGYTHKVGHRLDSVLASSLVAMYSKLGCIKDALKVFEQTKKPNVVAWSSMISALALHGKGQEAIELFKKMIRVGVKPNEVSFVAVLTACSHSGLLKQGKNIFKLLKESYQIEPGVEILTCMVDLFGRAGRLKEAKEFIEEHRICHMGSAMKSFLSSCRIHDEADMAQWASKHVKSDSLDGVSQVLVANVYADRHRWEDSANVRRSMQFRGVLKHPSLSRV